MISVSFLHHHHHHLLHLHHLQVVPLTWSWSRRTSCTTIITRRSYANYPKPKPPSASPSASPSAYSPQLPKFLRLCSLPPSDSDPNFSYDYDYDYGNDQIDDEGDDASTILLTSTSTTTIEAESEDEADDSSESDDITDDTTTSTTSTTSNSNSNEGGVTIETKKLPNNTRRIVSSVGIHAPLGAVWEVLTDYERLSDFIPGLALSRLLDRSPGYARLFQVGEQNLGLGLKFNAKGTLDCYEKQLQLQTIPSSSYASAGALMKTQKREIHFQMVQGDFDIFRGKWSIQQVEVERKGEKGGEIGGETKPTRSRRSSTRLWYMVDVKPKLWLPVGLVEGRLCNEITTNLSCIRQEALKHLN
ncbi:hypothetical protein L484_013899 [Morus notabilis]|uniref:Coenzyme Q-binding protein COQ10 START domain-containing protein n=1 Tax=Morus notabilis TaxID=981085 RepID=W9QNA8_9ROSA|nr:uncharacterized protein LOC21397061 [Morus notabilis]EXB44480.1 hypothetical protein L484_013899 [Morus notabilis]